MANYTTNSFFLDDMGSVPSFHVSESPMETKEENALWQINSMRRHDGLRELRELPSVVMLTPIAD